MIYSAVNMNETVSLYLRESITHLYYAISMSVLILFVFCTLLISDCEVETNIQILHLNCGVKMYIYVIFVEKFINSRLFLT